MKQNITCRVLYNQCIDANLKLKCEQTCVRSLNPFKYMIQANDSMIQRQYSHPYTNVAWCMMQTLENVPRWQCHTNYECLHKFDIFTSGHTFNFPCLNNTWHIHIAIWPTSYNIYRTSFFAHHDVSVYCICINILFLEPALTFTCIFSSCIVFLLNDSLMQ